ncbi:unnamed protein product [Closterium sp. NIES-53]
MHSRLLDSGLPRSLPPLPPSPAPPCLPCVEGRQRAAPHFSFPPTTAPLQTLHMDVWGPARISGQGRERYFMLVVDEYTRYTTVFPLRSKGEVSAVLIPWIRTVRLQLRERFGQDLPVLRLHSDIGGEFSSNFLRDFCRGEGILQSFTLPASPKQNGIAERRIGLVMEVARTSMIHAAAPHFQWPFAVWYAAHQLNLWHCVSLPETSPTLRWTGQVGDASVFRFYHSTSRCVFPSQVVTFDESVPFYRLFPYRSAPPPPPPLFRAPGPPPVDPLPPQGPAPSGAASGGAEPGGAEPGGAESEGGGSGGAEPGGAELEGAGVEPGGAELEGVEPGGAKSEDAEFGGAEPRGAASSGGPACASPRLSPQQLREWLVWHACLRSGATGTGGAGAAGAGGAGVTIRAGGTAGTAATGPGGAHTRGTGAGGTGGVGDAGVGDPMELGATGAGGSGAGGAGAGGARAGGTGAGGAGAGGAGVAGTGAGGAGAGGAGAVGPGDTVQPRPYFVPLLWQVLGVPPSTSLTPPLLCPPPNRSKLPLQSASPLPAPSPYTEHSGGLTERREPASRPVSPIRNARRVPRSHPPPIPGTHAMALRPSSVPLRVPLPAPPESSLPAVPDPKSDHALAATPTVSHLLATAIIDSSFETAAASALVCELLEFAAACRLDYTIALVAESQSATVVPRFASMLLAPEGDPDAPDIPTPRFYGEAITGPYSSQWQAAMDAERAPRSPQEPTVKRPSGSPPPFKARYVARGFSQRQWRDYELHSLDFSTAFLQGSLHEEIWLRHPPGFTGSFPAGTQWSLRRPVYGLRQVPREWHNTLMTTLAGLGFAPSTADTSLPPFYVLIYVDNLVFATIDTEALTLVKSELQKRHTCTDLGPCALQLPVLLATAHSSVYWPLALSSTFGRVLRRAWGSCLEDGVQLSSLVTQTLLGSSCEAEIYARAMAALELRWLTYLLTYLGEQPRSPPVVYVDNKAMIALCQEHRLEHRTKHIALRYILARELHQCGQLCLAYVATRANTADIFAKALPPGDHQRFSTMLGLVPTLPHLLTA